MKRLITYSLPVICCLLNIQVNCQIIFVNLNANGTGDGSSWDNAYNKLDPALAAATPGAQIWVATGSYSPDPTISTNSNFSLIGKVALYGGFNGTEDSLGQRDFNVNITTLNGDLHGDDDPQDLTLNRDDNATHVLRVEGADCIVDGFVICNGNTKSTATGVDSSGAGLLATKEIVVRNCTFSQNVAHSGGGLAFLDNSNSKLVVENCVFDNNYAKKEGGGLFLFESTGSSIKKCVFRRNTAQNGAMTALLFKDLEVDSCVVENNKGLDPQPTAGMHIVNNFGDQTTFKLKNTIFKENKATGLYIVGVNDTMYISNCLFEKNISTTYGYGASIWNYNSDYVIVKNCIFRNDTAFNAAGIFNDYVSNFFIDSCLFENNYATNNGGTCIYNWTVHNNGTISNCTFRNNFASYSGSGMINREVNNIIVKNCAFENGQARDGAAIYNEDGNVNIEKCLFTLNKAEWGGGAIGCSSGGNTIIKDCNFESNEGYWGGAINVWGGGTKIVIQKSLLEMNEAKENGGAIYVSGGANLILSNTDVVANTAEEEGGGVWVGWQEGSSLNVQNVTFENNLAKRAGGAISSSGGAFPNETKINVYKGMFTSNSASKGGAIYLYNGQNGQGALNVYNSQFSKNHVTEEGGAALFINMDATFVNSLFNENQCVNATSFGGALNNYATDTMNSNLSAINCTFVNNTAGNGSGIAQQETYGGQAELTLQNCVFSNDDDNYFNQQGDTKVITKGGNISSDASMTNYLMGLDDLNNQDPQLEDPMQSNFYPKAGSPCIDRGIAAGAPLDDLTGVLRIGKPDAGAFEYGTIVPLHQAFEALSLRLQPNPTTDFTTATIENDWTGVVVINLQDDNGKTIQRCTDTKSSQSWSFQLDMSRIATGVYALSIQTGSQLYVGKLAVIER